MARGRKPKFTPQQIDRDKRAIVEALEEIGSHVPFSDIAKHVGKDMYDLRWALNALLEEGRLMRQGKRRGAKYHLITEGMEVPLMEDDEGEILTFDHTNMTSEEIILHMMKCGKMYKVPDVSTMLAECRPKLRMEERTQVLSHMVKSGKLNAMRLFDDGYRLFLTKVA